MKPRTRSLLIHAFAATAALSLAACGGDGDDSPAPTPPPPPPPAPITLSGEVARIGTLRNVVVCLDLNANDACDAGEPASAATGADGRYSLNCAVIVKKVDAQTRAKTSINELLRD